MLHICWYNAFGQSCTHPSHSGCQGSQPSQACRWGHRSAGIVPSLGGHPQLLTPPGGPVWVGGGGGDVEFRRLWCALPLGSHVRILADWLPDWWLQLTRQISNEWTDEWQWQMTGCVSFEVRREIFTNDSNRPTFFRCFFEKKRIRRRTKKNQVVRKSHLTHLGGARTPNFQEITTRVFCLKKVQPMVGQQWFGLRTTVIYGIKVAVAFWNNESLKCPKRV